ncbi:uncharacterized protein MYCFIDRAFT_173698 [Pseudocercospora fijiensis CIRAD86]|uniref:Uncharacterized protein n=1 Tax=Pseudocercospora fijiensis (strain CIRAD86) TaxID=383855 RepID=M3AJP4_PSEFD|nr:uncharacterized protein MYCFIDRAFT_173698 [Pseudocercospora fijiensis CIRAD86]EME84771.1 hypothetical protein MYCFIDRAFT_173698 [Pseudocercospora fijiensis CIRAD86]
MLERVAGPAPGASINTESISNQLYQGLEGALRSIYVDEEQLLPSAKSLPLDTATMVAGLFHEDVGSCTERKY